MTKCEIADEMKDVENQIAIGRYLVGLLSAVLQGDEIPLLTADISWEQIYEFSIKHSVEVITFYGAQKYIPKESGLYEKWENRCNQNLVQSINQLAERGEIIKCFSEAKIPIVSFKGCRIKELYEQVHFRQMADLDFLIRPEDAHRAKKIMMASGYEVWSYDESHHDEYHKSPYVTVELHRAMLPEDSPYAPYYHKIYSRTIENGNPYDLSMSLEDEYIFMIIHLKKHLELMGCGIRAIMDVYLFREKYADEWNQKYLEEEIRKLGIQKFEKMIRGICESWFGDGKQNQDIDEYEKYIFLSGTYGSEMIGTLLQMKKYHVEQGKKETAKYMLQRVFMGMEGMKNSYPILKKRPFLLPVCWGHRIARILIFKRNRVQAEIAMLSHLKLRDKRKHIK